MTDLDKLTNLQKAMYEVNEKLYAVCHNGVFPCVVRKICDDGIAVDIITIVGEKTHGFNREDGSHSFTA